ncbi:MAG: M14 family metallopeptidase [Turneriella sp.]
MRQLFLVCLAIAVTPVHFGSPASSDVKVDESKIADEIQASKTRRPYFLDSGSTDSFRAAYQRRYGRDPVVTTHEGDKSIILLNAGEEREAAFAAFALRATGANPPFRYFDAMYEKRLARGFIGIEDLMAGYKDPALNEMLLAGVAKTFPQYAKLHTLGTTALGRPVLALELTNFHAQRKKIPLLFSCTMHGNELTATEHCYQIISEVLKKPRQYEIHLDHAVLWIVPMVNPDGNHLFWHQSSALGRKNAVSTPGQSRHSPSRGVDLNRNFPFRWNSGHPKASSSNPDSAYFRGVSPGSEQEVIAMMQLSERERFVYSFSFHAVAGRILVPYTSDNTRNPSPDYAWAFARNIAPRVRHHNAKRGFKAVKNIYPVDGTDQDYYYHRYGTLAYIIESSYRNCEYRYVPYYLEGYKALWEGALEDYAGNRKLVLRVTNRHGEAVPAELRFDDTIFYEGETRTANAADGTFIRLTKSSQPVRVTISAQGYRVRQLVISPQGPGYGAFTDIIMD